MANPPVSGFWRVITPENDVICVSYVTPLTQFARWIRVDSMHHGIASAVHRIFVGTLIRDQATWSSLNEVAMYDLRAQGLETGMVIDLGRLLLLDGERLRSIRDHPSLPQLEIPAKSSGENPDKPAAMIVSETENVDRPSPVTVLVNAINTDTEETGVLLEVSDEPNTLMQPDVHPTTAASQPPSPLLQPMIQLQPLKTFSVASFRDSATTQASAIFSRAQEYCMIAMNALHDNDVEKGRLAIQAALALLEE